VVLAVVVSAPNKVKQILGLTFIKRLIEPFHCLDFPSTVSKVYRMSNMPILLALLSHAHVSMPSAFAR